MKPVVHVRVQMEAFCASAEQEVVRLMDALAHVSTDAKSDRLEALRAALAGDPAALTRAGASAAQREERVRQHCAAAAELQRKLRQDGVRQQLLRSSACVKP